MPHDAPPAVGPLIRQARESGQLSRIMLARRCGVSREYIYMIETGENTPSKSLCIRMAKNLGLNPDDVLLAAGHVPSDILTILRANPSKHCEMLRRESARDCK